MDEATVDAILMIEIEDLHGWLLSRKGKRAEGSPPTDDELSVQLQIDELKKQQNINADIRMARSISRAVQDDGTTVANLMTEERRCAQDREMACRMSGQGQHQTVNPPDSRVNEEILAKFRNLNITQDHEDSDDGASTFSGWSSLYDSEQGVAESSTWAAGRKGTKVARSKPMKECNTCFEFGETIKMPCEHDYCKTCVVSLVNCSLVDETLFPPRCCGQTMSMSLIRPFITTELTVKYEQKAIEFGTAYRTYCYSCSVFMNPDDIKGYRAHCTKCNRDTCMLCKSEYHQGDCPKNAALEQVLQLAQEIGWQRCTSCQNMIERREGCNHMT